jgi:hypothetical protein
MLKLVDDMLKLLDDMLKLVDNQETADVVFLLGQEEKKIYAHRLILMARCKSFQVCNSGNKSISACNFMQLSYSLSFHALQEVNAMIFVEFLALPFSPPQARHPTQPPH